MAENTPGADGSVMSSWGTKDSREDESDDDRTEILSDAETAVYDRHGGEGAEDNFDTISHFWSAYLGFEIAPQDVANMMVLLKVARNADGVYTEDNYADIAGYAECGARYEGEGE